MNKTSLNNLLKNLPKKPGVYKFLDESNKIIYVGKAKNLSNRVKSYFQESKDKTAKTTVMVSKISNIETIIVDSELEAIMLETNLIKELKPKYNILMKDDKNFLYIKITIKDAYPKIYLTRKLSNDKSIYFGPKTSGFEIKKTVKILSYLLPYTKCQLNIEWEKDGRISKSQSQKSVCIFKDIDKDHSPCISELSEKEYKETINTVIDFFKGKQSSIVQALKKQMIEYAAKKQYEKAAETRDVLKNIENTLEKQKISSTENDDLDVIDIIEENNKYFVNLFQIRESRLINQENFTLQGYENSENLSEVFSSFIEQYYDKTTNFPETILIPEEPLFKSELQEWLSNKNYKKVKIEIPKIGRKNHLIELANKNAQNYARQMRIQWLSEEKKDPSNILPNLKEILKLPNIPKRIECYDISHLSGTNTIGSMVVFINGESDKSNYRQFNIKRLKESEINDFASMYEVLIRRLKYLKNLNKKLKVKIKDNQIYIQKTNVLSSVTFSKFDDHVVYEKIEVKNKNNHLLDLLLESLKKIKSKKYFVTKDLEKYKETFINAGFMEIDHPEYILGFYPQKQKKDESFESKPDLIIIDGGKGQLKYALKARDELGLKIPIISLAKKNEEIFLEDKTKILLQFGSGELSLIQRLRDEAHRFAITKNREKRNKKMTE